jgi:hypothetical protein
MNPSLGKELGFSEVSSTQITENHCHFFQERSQDPKDPVLILQAQLRRKPHLQHANGVIMKST